MGNDNNHWQVVYDGEYGLWFVDDTRYEERNRDEGYLTEDEAKESLQVYLGERGF